MGNNNNKDDKKDFEDVFDNIKDGFEDIKDGFKEEINNVKDTTASYTKEDIEENKVMGGLCYLGFLWLIPFFAKKDSPYVQFHLNQGLITILVCLALGAVSRILNWIPFVGWILSLALCLAALVLIIIGAVNGFTGKVKEQPFIGGIKLLSF